MKESAAALVPAFTLAIPQSLPLALMKFGDEVQQGRMKKCDPSPLLLSPCEGERGG
jgi:hypothetical protein